MTPQPLAGEQRQAVLAAVWNALHAREPELFEPEKLMQPGGIMTLDQHLDALVEIAEQMPAGRIEQSLARVVDDICTHCPQQGVAGSCAVRRAGACVLFAHARLILETIDSTLRGLRDSESDA